MSSRVDGAVVEWGEREVVRTGSEMSGLMVMAAVGDEAGIDVEVAGGVAGGVAEKVDGGAANEDVAVVVVEGARVARVARVGASGVA